METLDTWLPAQFEVQQLFTTIGYLKGCLLPCAFGFKNSVQEILFTEFAWHGVPERSSLKTWSDVSWVGLGLNKTLAVFAVSKAMTQCATLRHRARPWEKETIQGSLWVRSLGPAFPSRFWQAHMSSTRTGSYTQEVSSRGSSVERDCSVYWIYWITERLELLGVDVGWAHLDGHGKSSWLSCIAT